LDDELPGEGPGEFETPPEIQEPTDPDYWLDNIEDFADAYSYSYNYTYSDGSTYGYTYTYYRQYFYFEETGEYMYVYNYHLEYNDGSTYEYEYTYTYDATYYDTYIAPYMTSGSTYTYYKDSTTSVDQSLLDSIQEELDKLKPVV
jgi:hypothetical protein